MKYTRITAITFVLLAAIGLLGVYKASFQSDRRQLQQTQGYQKAEVRFKDRVIPVELARSDQQRSRGLSFRDSLPSGEGMLFVFAEQDYHAFWMKDMRFALDLIWIAQDTIVDIKSNMPPARGDKAPNYTPVHKANYVLEINAGGAEHNRMNVGDRIEIRRP